MDIHVTAAAVESAGLKELRESQTWLRYSQRMCLVSTDEVEPNLQECDELIAIFVASIRTAKKNIEYSLRRTFIIQNSLLDIRYSFVQFIQYSFTHTATPASDAPVTL